MPNTCSVTSCTGIYNPADPLFVFKMPQKPDGQKHAWLLALYKDSIEQLKPLYICSKHFRRMKSKPHKSVEWRLKLQRDPT